LSLLLLLTSCVPAPLSPRPAGCIYAPNRNASYWLNNQPVEPNTVERVLMSAPRSAAIERRDQSLRRTGFASAAVTLVMAVGAVATALYGPRPVADAGTAILGTHAFGGAISTFVFFIVAGSGRHEAIDAYNRDARATGLCP
jgi:hypothetical protein